MVNRQGAVRATAQRHGLSESAIEALWDALVRGRGQAQFSHPELGGMGQWSGGMVQIGDMFNTRLKARVAAACADLAMQVEESRGEAAVVTESRLKRHGTAASIGADRPRASVPRTGTAASVARVEHDRPRDFASWWPADYGAPASSGSQNGMRYAYFPDRHRLVVDRDGCIKVYDTSRHRLSGVSQAQSLAQTLVFTSQHGSVGLESFVETDE